MSDPKKYPSPPPDDFSKTTPNIPRADDAGSSDWEKTNYNTPKFAPQPPADDWGKTVANIPPIKDEPDFNKTYLPAANNSPKTPDWGVTDANIKLPADNNFGGENIGNQTNYGATSPFIQLPEAERAKYQNLPPTPTQAAEQKKQAEKKGIPGWFWAVGGLLTLFFFAVIAIVLVYFFFLRPTGFEIVIQSAPSRAEVWVDNTRWGITEGDGTLLVSGLKSGELKRLEIRHPNFTCEPREIEGKDGETVTITARCTQTAGTQQQVTPVSDDCQNFKQGEFEKAKRCANQALDNLKEPYSAEDIARALNLYIINFAVNKHDIKPDDLVFLEKASSYIKKLPATTLIEIGGHTDSDGTDEKNMVLSNNRAKSVRDAFVNRFGVNPNMLTEKGYGETRPRPNNQNRNDDEKFQNRRIEYTVVRK